MLLAGCGGGGGGGGGSTIVVGTVLDSANQDQPVAGARVEIGGASATTGADGGFRITGARAGATTAIITPANGTPQTVGLPVAITPGVPNGVGELFINIGQISGVVLTPQGQPAAGAFVSIIETGDNVTTSADGRFLVPNVPAGPTQIVVVLGTAAATVTVTVAATGVTDAGQIRLVDDPNPNPPGGPVTLTGTVRLSDNAGPEGTIVILLRNGVEIERGPTNSAGVYNFYVPVGTYTIVGRRAGYADATVPATVTNPSQPLTVDLTLNRQ